MNWFSGVEKSARTIGVRPTLRIVMIVTVTFVVLNVIIDLLYTAIDPRVRAS